MNQLIKLNQPKLHIAHQNEVLLLRRQLIELQEEMNALKHGMHKSNTVGERKITLISNGQHNFISINNIMYCKAEGNYTKVYCRSIERGNQVESCTCLFVSKTLKAIIELISPHDAPLQQTDFIRCHQSYVVNKNYVSGYHSLNGLQLNLDSECYIPVSRRNKKMVLERIG